MIAAGSLLESLLGDQINFPVGRVEYFLLRPFSFEEYLMASEQESMLELYRFALFPEYAHDEMSKLFLEYALIGGMPEVVVLYLQNKDLVSLDFVFDSLIVTYLEDVEKYATNPAQKNVIRHIIENAFLYAAERIKFEGFAASNYKSKDIGECFRLLEKTFLLNLVYPTT